MALHFQLGFTSEILKCLYCIEFFFCVSQNSCFTVEDGPRSSEGEQALSVEILGALAAGMQDALLQAVSPSPGEAEVIRLFPAWPDDWDVSFMLRCRGGYIISSQKTGREVAFVHIQSLSGERLRIHNPWDQCYIYSGGKEESIIRGDLIEMGTSVNESILLSCKKIENPELLKVRVSPKPSTGYEILSVIIPEGGELKKAIGKPAKS